MAEEIDEEEISLEVIDKEDISQSESCVEEATTLYINPTDGTGEVGGYDVDDNAEEARLEICGEENHGPEIDMKPEDKDNNLTEHEEAKMKPMSPESNSLDNINQVFIINSNECLVRWIRSLGFDSCTRCCVVIVIVVVVVVVIVVIVIVVVVSTAFAVVTVGVDVFGRLCLLFLFAV